MISLIVAVSENNVIGKEGGIPWYLPADLAHFKQTTMGHPIIMGRKTHESISRTLPGRYNVVITRQKDYQPTDGCTVVNSINEALNLPKIKADSEVFIIGGAEIYNQAMPLAERIYLTRIHTKIEGDKFFKLDKSQWREVSRQEYKSDSRNKYSYDFLILSKRN